MRSRSSFVVDTNVYPASPLETGSSSPSPRQSVDVIAGSGPLSVSISAPEGTSEATLSAMILLVQSRVFDELAKLRASREHREEMASLITERKT